MIRIAVGTSLAALLLFAGPARAETISPKVDPIVIKDFYTPLRGPASEAKISFPRAGWVTRLAVHIESPKGESADHMGLFCHSTFWAGNDPNLILEHGEWADGYRPESVKLTAAEGQNEVVFPKGYGLFVDSTTEYDLEVMLQNGDAKNFGTYKAKVDVDVSYQNDGARLKTLHGLAVSACPPGKPRCTWIEPWSVPTGAHEYQQDFTMPYSGTVHYITTHLHQYTESISLADAEGKVLFKTKVKNRGDGWPLRIPVYADAGGIPLKGGARYVFHQYYRNPLPDPIKVMSIMRLYVHRDGEEN